MADAHDGTLEAVVPNANPYRRLFQREFEFAVPQLDSKQRIALRTTKARIQYAQVKSC